MITCSKPAPRDWTVGGKLDKQIVAKTCICCRKRWSTILTNPRTGRRGTIVNTYAIVVRLGYKPEKYQPQFGVRRQGPITAHTICVRSCFVWKNDTACAGSHYQPIWTRACCSNRPRCRNVRKKWLKSSSLRQANVRCDTANDIKTKWSDRRRSHQI